MKVAFNLVSKLIGILVLLAIVSSVQAQTPTATPTPTTSPSNPSANSTPHFEPQVIVFGLQSASGQKRETYDECQQWFKDHGVKNVDLSPVFVGTVPLDVTNISSTTTKNHQLQKHNIYRLVLSPNENHQAALSSLGKLRGVSFSELNFYFTPSELSSDSLAEDLWGIRAIRANDVWRQHEGEGITVAVVDTGVDIAHEDLAKNIWINTKEIPGNCIDDDHNGFVDDINGYDFTNTFQNRTLCGQQVFFPKINDDVGHGTHVAGTIAAEKNTIGVVGVAPRAKIMGVKGLGRRGGTAVSLAQAIEYAIDNGARVINNSWGSDTDDISTVISLALKKAYKNNVVVVYALGNSEQSMRWKGYASTDSIINVGALNASNEMAFFSNFGAGLDVVAPGTEITSTFPPTASCNNNDIQSVGNRYCTHQGTSMAAPHVSGVAALMLSANPRLTSAQVKSIIRATATDIGPKGEDTSFGTGIVNAFAAVNASKTSPKSAINAPALSIKLPQNDSVYGRKQLQQGIPFEIVVSDPSFENIKVSLAPYDVTNVGYALLGKFSLLNKKKGGTSILFPRLSLGRYLVKVSATNSNTGEEISDWSIITADQDDVRLIHSIEQTRAPVKISVDEDNLAWLEQQTSTDSSSDRFVVLIQDLLSGKRQSYDLLTQPATMPYPVYDIMLSGRSLYYAVQQNFVGQTITRGLYHLNLDSKISTLLYDCGSNAYCIKQLQKGTGGKILWVANLRREKHLYQSRMGRDKRLLKIFSEPAPFDWRPYPNPVAHWVGEKVIVNFSTQASENKTLVIDPLTMNEQEIGVMNTTRRRTIGDYDHFYVSTETSQSEPQAVIYDRFWYHDTDNDGRVFTHDAYAIKNQARSVSTVPALNALSGFRRLVSSTTESHILLSVEPEDIERLIEPSGAYKALMRFDTRTNRIAPLTLSGMELAAQASSGKWFAWASITPTSPFNPDLHNAGYQIFVISLQKEVGSSPSPTPPSTSAVR